MPASNEDNVGYPCDAIVEQFQSWNGLNWQNSGKMLNNYDGNHRLTKSIYQLMSGKNNSQTRYTYDAEGNNISTTNLLWKYNNWKVADSSYYYYRILADIEEIQQAPDATGMQLVILEELLAYAEMIKI